MLFAKTLLARPDGGAGGLAWLRRFGAWLTHAKFSVGVTGIVFDSQGRVMLLKHTFRRRYPWGLVSGWVNRGESLEAALHREVAEETTLSIAIDRLFRVRKDQLHYAVEGVYVCHLLGGTFRPSNEITGIQWCFPDDLPSGTSPDHFPMIREAAALASHRVPPGCGSRHPAATPPPPSGC